MIRRYFVLLFLIPFMAFGQGSRKESVLSTGTWYKIAVRTTGIHKITFEDLVALGMDPASITPSNIRVYGNGGGMLPESNSKPRVSDLRENPVMVMDGNDGAFNPGDYILFYGEAPDRVKFNPDTKLFEHEKNLYSDQTFYFINADIGPGKRIGSLPSTTLPANSYSNRFSDFAFHEVDTKNLIRSGKVWVGEEFNDTLNQHELQFVFPNLDTTSGVRFNTFVVARCSQVSYFYLYANDSLVDQIPVDFTDPQSINIYARTKLKGSLFFHPRDTLRVKLVYPLLVSNARGWLNYIELNLQRRLIWSGPQMPFRDANSIGPDKITEFKMLNVNPDVTIWDVSDPDSIRVVEPSQHDSVIRFRLPTESLRQFIAMDGSFYYPVETIGPVENQNLHALAPAQLVIVTYPGFEQQADRLAAFHNQNEGITALVVRTDEIYNEFSSGAQDISAIRDFVKMLYDNGGPNRPRYVLLFGDGSYDYKDRIPGNTNFVPTFESTESFKFIGTFVTDDFFGLMGTNEGEEAAGTLELGTGRFPVATQEEGDAVVDKIIHYYGASDTILSSWRNNMTFVADDEDGNLHLNQAEELAWIVNTKYPEFNVNKIYNDAYQMVKIPSGVRYPDVNTAISKAVADGNLIINYTGHGGETGWSGELVLTMQDIDNWSNADKLPVFVTATCEFSRYDNPERYSAGEMVITKPRAGAVALFTTTRLALATSNFKLDTSFFRHLRDKGPDGKNIKLGDMIRIAKNNNANNTNIKNFVLLGDPAQTIAFPEYFVETTEINGTPAGTPDTLNGLETVQVKGQVTDQWGTRLTEFNGDIFPKVFDKPVTYTTLGNQPKSFPQPFQVQNSVLFDGKATVTNGEFTFNFVMPYTINLQYGRGKISYYARTDQTDATGFTDNVVIGGVDPSVDPLNAGPTISLFMDDRNFKDNGKTGLDPLLIADLYDANGINSLGLGIGHEILMVMDDDWVHPVVLNDYYSPDADKYQSGSVCFPLSGLSPGRHTITLKAWDLFNNPSEKSIGFYAFGDPSLTVTNVMNFPNPLTNGTTFSFNPEPGSGTIEIRIEIFSVVGQPVRELSFNYVESAQNPVLYYWDGTDDHGNKLGSGIYPYRVIFRSNNGAVSQTSRKLIIFR
jgi:hypothetical protein